jgi:L-ribulokinase
MPRYALGLDFGTESARALLVDVANGAEVATAVQPYPHGVVDEALPGTGVRLEPDWALQDPDDYWACLEKIVPDVLRQAGAAPSEVVGIGVDFTA